jgi:hypothetical protein
MISPLLTSLSSVGQLYQLARPYQSDQVKQGKAGESPVAGSTPQARAQAVADQVEISPQARLAAATTNGPDEASAPSDVEVQKLRQRDQDVRAHEAAHKAAAGQYGGPISYTYETGPDGRRYAVSGSVSIDVSPVAGDPQATIRKMEKVMRAAQAPGDASPRDHLVAAQAARQLEHAQQQVSSGLADGAVSLPSGKSCPSPASNPYQAGATSTVSSLIDTCA